MFSPSMRQCCVMPWCFLSYAILSFFSWVSDFVFLYFFCLCFFCCISFLSFLTYLSGSFLLSLILLLSGKCNFFLCFLYSYLVLFLFSVFFSLSCLPLHFQSIIFLVFLFLSLWMAAASFWTFPPVNRGWTKTQPVGLLFCLCLCRPALSIPSLSGDLKSKTKTKTLSFCGKMFFCVSIVDVTNDLTSSYAERANNCFL